MFDFLNGFEWLIILAIVLLLVGPTKLPQLARGVGEAIGELRKTGKRLGEGEELSEEEREALERLARRG